jgi:hypothetical protein
MSSSDRTKKNSNPTKKITIWATIRPVLTRFLRGRGVILILTLQATIPQPERKLTAIKRIVNKSVKDRHALVTQRGG